MCNFKLLFIKYKNPPNSLFNQRISLLFQEKNFSSNPHLSSMASAIVRLFLIQRIAITQLYRKIERVNLLPFKWYFWPKVSRY